MQNDLEHLVAVQGGVLTREQATAVCTSAEVRSNLRRGLWRRTPWPGVYRAGRCADEFAGRARAASLWLGGDLVACHSTAARLWGIDIRSADIAAGGDLHFLGPGDLDNRRLSGLWVHPSSLGTQDALRRHGLWCTPPARTACDVARRGQAIDVLATLDAALRTGTCTRDQLEGACAAQRGLRGITRVAAVVSSADGRAESPMESRMRWRFLAAGLPVPQVQFELSRDGRRHRLDLGWPERKLGAEYDGLEAHMTREQLAADRDRHNWFTDEGWRLLHFTAVDVYRRHEAMVRTVGRYLA